MINICIYKLFDRKQIVVVDITNKTHILTRKDFIEWMDEFGKLNGFKPLQHKVLVPRQ